MIRTGSEPALRSPSKPALLDSEIQPAAEGEAEAGRPAVPKYHTTTTLRAASLTGRDWGHITPSSELRGATACGWARCAVLC